MIVDNLTGQTLGQYRLQELLGIGGMGSVYRGYQANLERDVAIKLIIPACSNSHTTAGSKPPRL